MLWTSDREATTCKCGTVEYSESMLILCVYLSLSDGDGTLFRKKSNLASKVTGPALLWLGLCPIL